MQFQGKGMKRVKKCIMSANVSTGGAQNFTSVIIYGTAVVSF